jgi:hypothetical protein
MKFIRNFMAGFGPVSSIFDFLTFGIMLRLLHAGHTEFRTGWSVESIATQTLVVYVIRTRSVPFLRSRPSLPMLLVPTGAALVGAVLPYTSLAWVLGFHAAAGRFLRSAGRPGGRVSPARGAGQDVVLPRRPATGVRAHPRPAAGTADRASRVALHPPSRLPGG